MNYFVFFFVVVSTLIDMALIYYSHFHGGDAVFQAVMANYMLTLIIFVEIYDGRRK